MELTCDDNHLTGFTPQPPVEPKPAFQSFRTCTFHSSRTSSARPSADAIGSLDIDQTAPTLRPDLLSELSEHESELRLAGAALNNQRKSKAATTSLKECQPGAPTSSTTLIREGQLARLPMTNKRMNMKAFREREAGASCYLTVAGDMVKLSSGAWDQHKDASESGKSDESRGSNVTVVSGSASILRAMKAMGRLSTSEDHEGGEIDALKFLEELELAGFDAKSSSCSSSAHKCRDSFEGPRDSFEHSGMPNAGTHRCRHPFDIYRDSFEHKERFSYTGSAGSRRAADDCMRFNAKGERWTSTSGRGSDAASSSKDFASPCTSMRSSSVPILGRPSFESCRSSFDLEAVLSDFEIPDEQLILANVTKAYTSDSKRSADTDDTASFHSLTMSSDETARCCLPPQSSARELFRRNPSAQGATKSSWKTGLARSFFSPNAAEVDACGLRGAANGLTMSGSMTSISDMPRDKSVKQVANRVDTSSTGLPTFGPESCRTDTEFSWFDILDGIDSQVSQRSSDASQEGREEPKSAQKNEKKGQKKEDNRDTKEEHDDAGNPKGFNELYKEINALKATYPLEGPLLDQSCGQVTKGVSSQICETTGNDHMRPSNILE